MQFQRLAPLLVIAAGVTLHWLGTPAIGSLAWIFVAGGLAGALLNQLVLRRNMRPATPSCDLPKAVLLGDPEQWSRDVSVIAADALADAGLVTQSAVPRAAEIIGEEIAVRLSIGDYPAQALPEHRPGA
jgi:hypothetical protein